MADGEGQDRGALAGAIVLIGATVLALAVANGPGAVAYHRILGVAIGPLDLRRWIDDGLMALFFLAVGLEVKGALADGPLADRRARILPITAAACGMIVPAALYLAVAGGAAGARAGWAIPAATDIAFAQGVLALVGRGVPASLRLFLTSVAIADDIGAVAIIALAFTPAPDPVMLGLAGAVALTMIVLNRRGVGRLWPYLLLFVLLWMAMGQAGVHPTLAGIVTAFAIPLRGRHPGVASPLHRLERLLSPAVTFLVVPLFAFANAGLSLRGLSPAMLLAPIPLGIVVALVLGKQAGVLLGVALGRGIGGRLPAGIGWGQLHGVALLCGIGFTMSLFIGGLAFPDVARQDAVRLGVLTGSLVASVAGLLVLRACRPPA